jgi:lipid-A-disaccharide synthase
MAKTKALDASYYDYFKNNNIKWEIFDDSKELLYNSMVGVVKTGTSTLESALLGMPFIMFYKTSFVSYYFGKNLINLPYISLPNILLKKPLIKELFQRDANPKAIADEINKLITNIDYYKYLQSEFENIRAMLGGSGASLRAGKIIYEFLGNK